VKRSKRSLAALSALFLFQLGLEDISVTLLPHYLPKKFLKETDPENSVARSSLVQHTKTGKNIYQRTAKMYQMATK
jgi:hypothetical protein